MMLIMMIILIWIANVDVSITGVDQPAITTPTVPDNLQKCNNDTTVANNTLPTPETLNISYTGNFQPHNDKVPFVSDPISAHVNIPASYNNVPIYDGDQHDHPPPIPTFSSNSPRFTQSHLQQLCHLR